MDIQMMIFLAGLIGSLIVFIVLLVLAKRPAKLSNLSVIILVTSFLVFLGMTAVAPLIHVDRSFSSGVADE